MATSAFPFSIGPLTNITPFTYPPGLSMLEVLYELRDYINLTLRPEFDAEMTDYFNQFQAGVANAEAWQTTTEAAHTAAYNAFTASTNAAITAFEASVNSQISAFESTTNTSISTFETTTNNAITAFEANVNGQISTFEGTTNAAITAFEAAVNAQVALINTGQILNWASGLNVTTGQKIISPSNDVVTALSTFTTGGTYNPANWSTPTPVKKGDLCFNVKDYGAKGDGVADDTAGILAAWNASSGNIFFPQGTYIYNGTGLPVFNRPRIIGSGRGGTTINLGSTSRLIDINSALLSLHISNVRIVGGIGTFRSLWTASNVAGIFLVEDVEFKNYTGAAIETNSSDWPYWKFSRCVFDGANFTTTFGIAHSGLSDGMMMENCEFLTNRVGVKLRRGGNNAHFKNCDFIRFGPTGGSPRIDVWVVPNSSSTNAGAGFTLTSCKFGPENLDAADKRIVYADELAGTNNADQWPNLAGASAGYISGHNVHAVMLGGISAANPPLVFSTTPNIRGCRYSDINIQGTEPQYLFQFLSAPAGDMYNSRNIIGPMTGLDLGATPVPMPLASNGVGVFAVVDPNQLLTPNPDVVLPNFGSDPVGFKLLFNNAVSTMILDSGLTRVADTDSHGGTDAGDITFPTTSAGPLRGQIAGTAVNVGQPVWIEFDAKAGTITKGSIQANYDASSPVFKASFTMNGLWNKYRFLWIPRASSGTLNIGINKLLAGDTGDFHIGRVRVYHAREPQNVDGVVIISGTKYKLSVSGGTITATATT